MRRAPLFCGRITMNLNWRGLNAGFFKIRKIGETVCEVGKNKMVQSVLPSYSDTFQ